MIANIQITKSPESVPELSFVDDAGLLPNDCIVSCDKMGENLSLESNLGLVVTAVNAIMPETPYHRSIINTGLNAVIVDSVIGSRSSFGTYSERDDLFQEACLEFLVKRHKYDASRGSVASFMLPVMLQSFQRRVLDTAIGVRYTADVFTARRKTLEITPQEEIPDGYAYGHEEVDGDYTTRWLPVEDIALTPRYDVVGEPSGEVYDQEQINVLQEALGYLPERDLEILLLYFNPKISENGNDKARSQEGVSEELGLGLSRQRVSQIISRAIKNTGKQMARIERQKEKARNTSTNHQRLTATEKEIQRQKTNKQRLQELAQAKFALGGMIINGVGVVIKVDESDL